MSRSPESAEEGAAADYTRGWAAINKLMRRGFSWSGHEKHNAFLNLAGRGFADASHAVGFALSDDGRALAPVDWDLDGDIDLFVTNRNAPRVRFLENRSPREAWTVSLLLRGTRCNAAAVGARVELKLAGEGPERLVRAVRAGEGYLAQASAWLTFGSGERAIERVTVHWPGGEAEVFDGVRPGGRHLLVQGTGTAEPWTVEGEHQLGPDQVAPPPPPEAHGTRIVLAAPVPLPQLIVRPPDRDEIPLFGIGFGGTGAGTGRPVLLSLWASWCPPCVVELEALVPRSAELDAAGLALLAVSVDEDGDAARELMERIGWPTGWAFAAPRTIEILDVLQGAILDRETRLPLPSSFLIDAEGSLRAIYLGRVDPDRLLEDVALTRLPIREMRDAATPFAGTWYRPAQALSLELFERRFDARGLPDVAREYGNARIEVRETTRAKMLFDFGRQNAAAGRLQQAVDYLQRAIREDPRLFAAHLDLGIVLHRLGRAPEAIAAYAAAVRLEPEHEDARFNLALAYLGVGDVGGAERELAELEERGSPLASALAAQIERLRDQ